MVIRLEDRFQVVKLLGQGGFGRVLLVRDRRTDVHVAAKVMKGPVTIATRQRFVREVKQLERYSAVGQVIPVLEKFLEAKRPFFTMPLAKGNLEQWAGRLSAPQVAVAMLRVMEALAAVHADGGFHRDIKPGNLFVLEKGETVVGDFGLGNNPHVTRNFTRKAQGTFAYMAPELLAADPAHFTFACDVYSAGASWYHLVTGKGPAIAGGPLDPRRVKPNADAWTSTWIGAMTRRDPTQRPTAEQAAAAIRQRIRPSTVPAPRPAGNASASTAVRDALAVGAVFGVLALIIAAAAK
ncbi:MAG: serine/threonine protein kinase [Deltaproteobacteria bacterium]|nr:serine/threonine protein kinase [Deltaproteobacteria bacterium]